MYIAAKTEDGDVIYWGYGAWRESIYDAESFGALSGAFKMGELEAEYVDTSTPRTYKGARILYIREL